MIRDQSNMNVDYFQSIGIIAANGWLHVGFLPLERLVLEFVSSLMSAVFDVSRWLPEKRYGGGRCET